MEFPATADTFTEFAEETGLPDGLKGSGFDADLSLHLFDKYTRPKTPWIRYQTCFKISDGACNCHLDLRFVS
jgi:hypothetical protein